ncbi:MAG: hypothetical protein ACUVR7_02185 [Armatimonadota bacterium]
MAGQLGGCVSTPRQKIVYVQWQALLVYHPLWEAQSPVHTPQPAGSMYRDTVPSALLLPDMTVQPMQTAESERRRQRVMQATEQQLQALTARLQQVESRLLQDELTQLEAERKAQVETAKQQTIHQAERGVEESLRRYQSHQATAEIRRRVVQRLLRVRPDQRDALGVRLKEIEADQQALSEQLQSRLAQIEEDTAVRIRERAEAIEKEYERKREELHGQSTKRLQAEQARASLQIRAFVNGGEPIHFPRTAVTLPPGVTRDVPAPPLSAIAQEDLRPAMERDVKQWVKAICRLHRWLPVWQARSGIPDATAQIAQEMRSRLR